MLAIIYEDVWDSIASAWFYSSMGASPRISAFRCCSYGIAPGHVDALVKLEALFWTAIEMPPSKKEESSS